MGYTIHHKETQGSIDSSDYYVLIIGGRYGSVMPDGKPDAGMSYTEKEYRYAKSRGIPILGFIKDQTTITADMAENDPDKYARLNAFEKEITDGKNVDLFKNADELTTKVLLSLLKQIKRTDRPGWIRTESDKPC